MIYTIAKEIVFIPEWNENKKLPEGEQIKIYISLPSTKQITDNYLNEKDNAVINEFYLYVKRIKHLQIKDGDKIRVGTPKDLIETAGLSELWAEVKNFYTDMKSIDKKK